MFAKPNAQSNEIRRADICSSHTFTARLQPASLTASKTKGQRIRAAFIIPMLALSLFATFAHAESAHAQRVTNNGRDRRPNREVPIQYPRSRQATNSQSPRLRTASPTQGTGNQYSQSNPSLATSR